MIEKIPAHNQMNNQKSDIKATFEIQVLSTSAIKCRGKFRIFQFPSAMRQQKNLPKT